MRDEDKTDPVPAPPEDDPWTPLPSKSTLRGGGLFRDVEPAPSEDAERSDDER